MSPLDLGPFEPRLRVAGTHFVVSTRFYVPPTGIYIHYENLNNRLWLFCEVPILDCIREESSHFLPLIINMD